MRSRGVSAKYNRSSTDRCSALARCWASSAAWRRRSPSSRAAVRQCAASSQGMQARDTIPRQLAEAAPSHVAEGSDASSALLAAPRQQAAQTGSTTASSPDADASCRSSVIRRAGRRDFGPTAGARRPAAGAAVEPPAFPEPAVLAGGLAASPAVLSRLAAGPTLIRRTGCLRFARQHQQQPKQHGATANTARSRTGSTAASMEVHTSSSASRAQKRSIPSAARQPAALQHCASRLAFLASRRIDLRSAAAPSPPP
mmetsp:Transcript_2717/g.10933  ORF Transcript_2717/g.10933 Transcript_2717/m.10933 type:complete len:256 (+) Transcript_2717:1862-2629(+)